MNNNRNKKTTIISIGVTLLLLMVSFTSVIGYHLLDTSINNQDSPLFHLRLEQITNPTNTQTFSQLYLGQDTLIDIPLPAREIITPDIVTQLSSQEITEKIWCLNCNLVDTWTTVLTIARNNLREINRIIRQNYQEFETLAADYYALSPQEAQEQFLIQLETLNNTELSDGTNSQQFSVSPDAITSGFFCNITSGQFCQITSQPICNLTTQPICSLTKGFFCWTIIGPICPTTGIKCNPPTSRPTLCTIFSNAGKILKTILSILLLAIIIFVPLVILSLVFITIFNAERCSQIHDRITTRFNCTNPK